MSYHKMQIPQGKYGEISKVLEELYELMDAIEQRNPILALVELSDVHGAISGYMTKSNTSWSSLSVPFDYINPYCNAMPYLNYTTSWVQHLIWLIEDNLDQLERNQQVRYSTENILGIISMHIIGYVRKVHPQISYDDVRDMANLTEGAFRSGHRKPKS